MMSVAKTWQSGCRIVFCNAIFFFPFALYSGQYTVLSVSSGTTDETPLELIWSISLKCFLNRYQLVK